MDTASRPSYTVRKATRDDIAGVKQLTVDEAWELDTGLLYDVFDMDDRAWFVAVTEDGEIIGVRALIYYNDEIDGGIYIVKSTFRGKGVGRDVNAAALAVVEGSNIVLSANNIKLYDTKGFTYDYDIHQTRLICQDLLSVLPNIPGFEEHINPYSDNMFDDLAKYDASICKHNRLWFLKNWIIKRSKCMLLIFKDSEIVGYGCLRNTEYGFQVAPLYAESNSLAWVLLRNLLSDVTQSATVDLFISARNRAMIQLIEGVPHQTMDTLYKMYNKHRVDIPLDNVFSLTAMFMTII